MKIHVIYKKNDYYYLCKNSGWSFPYLVGTVEPPRFSSAPGPGLVSRLATWRPVISVRGLRLAGWLLSLPVAWLSSMFSWSVTSPDSAVWELLSSSISIISSTSNFIDSGLLRKSLSSEWVS